MFIFYNKILKLFSLLFFIIFSQIIFAEEIDIKSRPDGVDIFIITSDISSPEGIKLGKTPFKQDLKELITTYVKKNNFILEFRKEGFENYRILFTKNIDLDIEVFVNMEESKVLKDIKKYDFLTSDLFEVQRLIRNRNFRDALTKLDKLESDFPNFSIISELKGTTYYLMKDIENALSQYRKAFYINSENVDAYKMKVYIEKKYGLDMEIK